MSAVRFSVVIPTRERAETLRFALRTCLDQQFKDYEVIVSDNCSSPATKAVVDEAASPKVRYVRTPEPVAMSANWEFAVSHARGEYVTVLGDDDGLLPHALSQLEGLVQRHSPKAVRWGLVLYTWPTFMLRGHENYIRLPLGNTVVERDGMETIQSVAESLESYEDLPMIYNSAIRRDVLDELRTRTGRVFPHPVPDLYSGFSVAGIVGRFLSTTLPLAVRGLSGSSNGIAALFAPGRTSIEREFHALNAKDGLRSDPRVPALPALPAYTADTLLSARRLLFPDHDIQLDRRKLVRACLNCVRVIEADWPATLETVRRSLVDDPELLAWFDTELAGSPHVPVPPTTYFKPERLGFKGMTLHLDATAFGVTDVATAARLCGYLLNCPADGYTPPDDANAVARQVTELTAPLGPEGLAIVQRALGWWEILEQVRALHQLNMFLKQDNGILQTACDERMDTIHQMDGIIHRLDDQARNLLSHLDTERRWSIKRPVRLAKRMLAKLTRRGAGKPTASV
jgi:hypothetical protein